MKAAPRESAQQIPANKQTDGSSEDKPWLQSFGKLCDLHLETARIDRIIEEEFSQVELEDYPGSTAR
jgi:hypothetical protein